MIEFVLYDGAAGLMAPRQCVCCGGDDLPMVDTIRQIPEFTRAGHVYRVYVCPRCVRQMARLHGYVDADTHHHAVRRADILAERVANLETELDRERSPESKVISVRELTEHYARGGAA